MRGRLKGAIAVAQNNGNGPSATCGIVWAVARRHREVRNAIPIEVACCNRVRIGASRVVDAGLETAIPVADKHTHIVAAGIGNDQVQFLVSGQICSNNGVGYIACAIVDRCLESAAAVPYSTLTVLPLPAVTAMSGRPSPLKSPTVTDVGKAAVG